jgi:hypothetical protein
MMRRIPCQNIQGVLVVLLLLSCSPLLSESSRLFVNGFVPVLHQSSRGETRLQVLQDSPKAEPKQARYSSLSPLPPRRPTTLPSSKKRAKPRGGNQKWVGEKIPRNIPKLSDVLLDVSSSPGPKSNSEVANKVITTTDSSSSSSPRGEPWKAGYYTSLKSQKRIQLAASSARNFAPIERASRVLETFLSIPPERCNAANLVCALTLSAKVMGRETNDRFRGLLYETMEILSHSLLRDKSLSVRQLCNVAWAIAKHSDRDDQLLPLSPHSIALSAEDAVGQAVTWDLNSDLTSGPEQRLDAAIDEIARQITVLLKEDSSVAKEGELCMASWAYGVLRKRRRPPGWKQAPQLGYLPSEKSSARSKDDGDGLDVIRFEQWNDAARGEEWEESDGPSPTDLLFDQIGQTLVDPLDVRGCVEDELPLDKLPLRLQACKWSELANLAWAFASHGRSCSDDSQKLMLEVAHEATRRLGDSTEERGLSRDVAQIIWALGTLQADNFRLAEGLIEFVGAIGEEWLDMSKERPFGDWSCPDLVQVALSLAHARLDDLPLLRELYAEARERLTSDFLPRNASSQNRKTFLAWEVSILLWSQARLYLDGDQGDVFPLFAEETVVSMHKALKDGHTMESLGIGSQEQANIAWSLTVLELYQSSEAQELLRDIFSNAANSCETEGIIQLEHAHQLWQAMFVLEGECPACVGNVSQWFRDYLHQKWLVEKSRAKISSARHRSLSKLLHLMGVSHYNEHDEDIDVAIVLKSQAIWTHETESTSTQREQGVKIAVEFDGPNHFTRQEVGSGSRSPEQPRALGHTILKYRLLKRQGWTVVRVPYYEFDKIPFWASMERQRYLQRLLKVCWIFD